LSLICRLVSSSIKEEKPCFTSTLVYPRGGRLRRSKDLLMSQLLAYIHSHNYNFGKFHV
jgi:hypothetical protein